jgi:2-oxoisovalerate dehydrogenase E1 component
VPAALDPSPALERPPLALDREEALALYRALRLPRAVEEKMLRLIRQNRLSKWFSGYGQEAIAVGCAWALREDDWLLPMHRNLGLWTARGVELRPLLCQIMGRAGGFTNGRDRTFHFGLPEKRIVGMISHLGAMLPVACGLGLGARLDGSDAVACAFVGEGSTREGDFHEALSLASVWKLPVLFVVENNGYGLSTPTAEAVPVEDIADAASGYGMPGEVVDGNDLLAVISAVKRAAARARAGEGPTLLEMKTFRMRGHEEASGTRYVPPELFEAWALRDPLLQLKSSLTDLLTGAELEAVDADLTAQVEADVEWALAQPEVSGTPEAEASAVFAPAPRPAGGGVPPVGEGREVRFIDAVQEGLRQGMEADPRVVLMGQDIAEYGGVFKVTEGFLEAFGPERVRNTPIIESGAVGAAMGLALAGYTPVLEMQYADFITCGFNQIVNNLGTTHYRWGAPLNVTIRAPFGGGIGAGPFHSQSPEAWFCHAPGLKVVVPGSPYDAKGLLLAALADPNPVLFFEHKRLYRALKGLVPEEPYAIPLGVASVVREGDALTLVTYGTGVAWALEEAAFWAERGVELDVLDLRTLVPWDRPAVLASVEKTGRLIVLHEAQRTAGFGAEVTAEVAEAAFGHLDAPPVRVTSEDWPIPFSKGLEALYSAQGRLRPAIERTLAY